MRLNYKEWSRCNVLEGPKSVARRMEAALSEKKFSPKDFSLRDAFEGLVPDGESILREMSRRGRGGMTLLEAGQAVDTSAFSNITGQIIYSRIRETFSLPEMLWPGLCTQTPTEFLDSERIPGIGGLGDHAQEIMEGDEYPTIGLSEEYVDRGKLRKQGHIVPVTKEAIIADRSGKLLSDADAGAKWLSVNCEKRFMSLATGSVNNYKRNGTTTNTYLTSGAYVNSIAGNPLYDWTNFQTAFLTMTALTDPNTGEPIAPGPLDLLIPPGLIGNAFRVQSATSVEHVDNTASATSIRTMSGNPVNALKLFGEAKVSQYVALATGNNTTWFGGDWKKAITRFYAWDITTVQAPTNSEAEFTRDITMRFKTSMMDMFQMLEPRYLFKSAA